MINQNIKFEIHAQSSRKLLVGYLTGGGRIFARSATTAKSETEYLQFLNCLCKAIQPGKQWYLLSQKEYFHQEINVQNDKYVN